jgi:hypothetical protein
VQIVGGPRDGQLVPYVGAIMREAVPTPAVFRYDGPPPPISEMRFRDREYVLCQWFDGRTTQPRYVLREQAKDLGVPNG